MRHTLLGGVWGSRPPNWLRTPPPFFLKVGWGTCQPVGDCLGLGCCCLGVVVERGVFVSLNGYKNRPNGIFNYLLFNIIYHLKGISHHLKGISFTYHIFFVSMSVSVFLGRFSIINLQGISLIMCLGGSLLKKNI